MQSSEDDIRKNFFNAVDKGDLKTVKHYIDNELIHIDTRLDDGSTALHNAILGQHYAIIDFLLERNAKCNIKASIMISFGMPENLTVENLAIKTLGQSRDPKALSAIQKIHSVAQKQQREYESFLVEIRSNRIGKGFTAVGYDHLPLNELKARGLSDIYQERLNKLSEDELNREINNVKDRLVEPLAQGNPDMAALLKSYSKDLEERLNQLKSTPSIKK